MFVSSLFFLMVQEILRIPCLSWKPFGGRLRRPSRDSLVREWSAPAVGSSGPLTKHHESHEEMGLYIARDFPENHRKTRAGLARILGILPGWKERETFLRGEKWRTAFNIRGIGVLASAIIPG